MNKKAQLRYVFFILLVLTLMPVLFYTFFDGVDNTSFEDFHLEFQESFGNFDAVYSFLSGNHEAKNAYASLLSYGNEFSLVGTSTGEVLDSFFEEGPIKYETIFVNSGRDPNDHTRSREVQIQYELRSLDDFFYVEISSRNRRLFSPVVFFRDQHLSIDNLKGFYDVYFINEGSGWSLDVDNSESIFLTDDILLSGESNFEAIGFTLKEGTISRGTIFTAYHLEDNSFLCSSEMNIDGSSIGVSCNLSEQGFNAAVPIRFELEYQNEVVSRGIGVVKNIWFYG